MEINAEVADRIRGVLFGQAVGDALGFGAEFLSRSDTRLHYPDGLHSYSQITRFPPCPQWQPGDWTDDTDQMLCILDSLLACHALDVGDIAARLHRWALSDGFGIGSTVYAVVRHPRFLVEPQAAAREHWEAGGRRQAANGGVMRTSVLGVWHYPSLQRVRDNAEAVCRLTHYDPRCVASAVAVCLAIRQILCGASDMAELVDWVAIQVRSYHPEVGGCFEMAAGGSLEALDLDEGMSPGEDNRLGYTLKTLGAAFWALRHAQSFAEGVQAMILEGGDADTNAAVAGALLGARFGYHGIDRSWREELVHGKDLEERAEKLVSLCSELSHSWRRGG